MRNPSHGHAVHDAHGIDLAPMLDFVVNLRSVRAHMEQLRAANPESGVVLIADQRAPTGTVVAVVDQIHSGGVWDVTFTTTRLVETGDRR